MNDNKDCDPVRFCRSCNRLYTPGVTINATDEACGDRCFDLLLEMRFTMLSPAGLRVKAMAESHDEDCDGERQPDHVEPTLADAVAALEAFGNPYRSELVDMEGAPLTADGIRDFMEGLRHPRTTEEILEDIDQEQRAMAATLRSYGLDELGNPLSIGSEPADDKDCDGPRPITIRTECNTEGFRAKVARLIRGYEKIADSGTCTRCGDDCDEGEDGIPAGFARCSLHGPQCYEWLKIRPAEADCADIAAACEETDPDLLAIAREATMEAWYHGDRARRRALASHYYDAASTFLDEHVPELSDTDGDRANAVHVALVDLLCDVHEAGGREAPAFMINQGALGNVDHLTGWDTIPICKAPRHTCGLEPVGNGYRSVLRCSLTMKCHGAMTLCNVCGDVGWRNCDDDKCMAHPYQLDNRGKGFIVVRRSDREHMGDADGDIIYPTIERASAALDYLLEWGRLPRREGDEEVIDATLCQRHERTCSNCGRGLAHDEPCPPLPPEQG